MRPARSSADLGFTWADRRRVQTALRAVQDKRLYQRLRAVYLVASTQSLSAVAQWMGVCVQSPYNWVQAYLRRHQVEELGDAARSGRPRSAQPITAARILREWRRDPLRLGYSTTVWTVALLATHLSERFHCPITPRTLRRRRRQIGLCWKRPRYVYATKEPHRAQKKGRLSDACNRCRRARSCRNCRHEGFELRGPH